MHTRARARAHTHTHTHTQAAILTGSIAERVRFGPMLIFISMWHLLVYCPLCHWEWGGGFMSSWGVLDFAGGDVVHIRLNPDAPDM